MAELHNPPVDRSAYEPNAPALGDAGDRCGTCGVPLAGDQRYCLNCGSRRAEARIPFMEILGQRAGVDTQEREIVATTPARPAPTAQAIGIGVGMVILLIGFGSVMGTLLARWNRPAPVVVGNTGGPVAGQTALASNGPADSGPFKGDWPNGKDGYTVQLRALKKEGSNAAGVAEAKKAAEGEGAKEVGALDSDEYKSLTPANYVIYSGVFDGKKEATERLDEVKAKFPDAEVIKVAADKDSSGKGGGDEGIKADEDKASNEDLLAGKERAVVGKDQLDDIQRASGDSKQSIKLPKEIAIEGKPPPKDGKAPGQGPDKRSADTTVIK